MDKEIFKTLNQPDNQIIKGFRIRSYKNLEKIPYKVSKKVIGKNRFLHLTQEFTNENLNQTDIHT